MEHQQTLLAQATQTLNLYTPYAADYRVTFTQEGETIAAHLVRTDGTPFAQSDRPLDQKLAHLAGQTARVRPFFLPMSKPVFDDTAANEFTTVDFDYAAILGYAVDPETGPYLKALYFLPVDALLAGRKPKADGVWRLPLATYRVHQLSLDPRKKFARFLYLVERITEGLEYQFDKTGRFFSVTPQD